MYCLMKKVPCLYLIGGPAAETVRLKAVDPQDLDGSLDAEVVKHTAHLQTQQIILITEDQT